MSEIEVETVVMSAEIYKDLAEKVTKLLEDEGLDFLTSTAVINQLARDTSEYLGIRVGEASIRQMPKPR